MDPTEANPHEAISEGHHPHHSNKMVAILIATLAAALALADLAEKQASTNYVTALTAELDDYAFYQAKNQRATMLGIEQHILASLPNAADQTVQASIKRSATQEAHERDDPGGQGMKQLLARDTMTPSCAPTPSIGRICSTSRSAASKSPSVLASVSVITEIGGLAIAAGVIGGIAGLFGLLVLLL